MGRSHRIIVGYRRRKITEATIQELPTPTYRADIDGLRALAVLPVVLYHAGVPGFAGGFVGVDVFFVISGYLITSIIGREIQAGEFRLARFYARRARRLFPALFAVVLACCIAAWFLLMPWELEDFGQSVATTALFSSNFLFFSEAGYFDTRAELKPLLHTWSLAIEEQYYLLFPGFLILLRRFGGGRLVTGTLILCLASFALAVWSVAYAPDAAFYLLPSRTWELLLGSLLALAGLPRLERPVREALALAGCALIAWGVFAYSEHTPFPGLAALAPCLGTALVILTLRSNDEATVTHRLLATRPLVAVGLISYSLYLWHWPLIAFSKHYLLRDPTWAEALALVAASIGIAWASWAFVERPFRHSRARRGWFEDRALLQVSAAAILVAVAVGLVYDASEGVPSRLPPRVAEIAAVATDKPPERKRCEGIKPRDISFDRLCRVNALDAPPSFIVWGDSHAMSAMPAVRAVTRALGVNGLNATSNGCVPLLGVSRPTRDLRAECVAFNQRIFDLIAAHPELETIVWIARWARHAEGIGYGEVPGELLYLARGDLVAATRAENHVVYADALETTLTALTPLGRRIAVVGPIPEIGVEVPNVLAKAAWQGRTINLALPRDANAARQRFVLQAFEAAGRNHDFAFYPVDHQFCDAAHCAADEGGLALYFDDNHVSSRGARRLEPVLQLLFEEAGAMAPGTPALR